MTNQLRNDWTFWYDKPDPKMCLENWDQFLIRMGSIQTIEELWSLLNNIFSLKHLPPGSNFHLFKTGIEPKWEDLENQDGGKWILEVPKSEPIEFEKLMKKSILLVLGTELDETKSGLINGIVISPRKEQNRISIWTKCASNKTAQNLIGEEWKRIIQKENFTNSLMIEYLSHKIVPVGKFERNQQTNNI